eukprot:scaffold4059_cov177-Amphora_coffeaeformis.AAC.17
MATPQIPPRLARVLYRSMLRASHSGRHPEVFGYNGATAFNSQSAINDEDAAFALPETPKQVRQRIKSWFQQAQETPVSLDGTSDNDVLASPLEVLRHVRQQASVLPCAVDKSKPLPIFDYSGVAALPGETIQFAFVEPRYLQLALRVVQSESRHFLLRPGPEAGTATLLQIVSHIVLPNEMMAVACLGGPRIFVRQLESEEVEGDVDPYHAKIYGLSTEKTLHTATDFCLRPDTDAKDVSNFLETRQYLLHLLQCILPHQGTTLTETLPTFGLPPLEPEVFSYWILRYVLAVDDVNGRLEWLHGCTSTHKRLEVLVRDFEDILDHHESRQEAA